MTETRPLSPTRIDVAGLAATAWLTGTMFPALLMLYFVGLTRARRQSLGRTPTLTGSSRRPAPAGLPLSLGPVANLRSGRDGRVRRGRAARSPRHRYPRLTRQSQPVQDAADFTDRLAVGGLLVVRASHDHRRFRRARPATRRFAGGLGLGAARYVRLRRPRMTSHHRQQPGFESAICAHPDDAAALRSG